MAKNILFILSDQHNKSVTGAYGNPVARTPNLDRLAAGGTTFSQAYTNCPLCCPAQTALATGKHVHQTEHWSNAFAYSGEPLSWAHRLREAGHRIDAIGKLHYRSSEDDNGFTQEHNTLHVVGGQGNLSGNLRHDTTIFDKRKGVLEAGFGESMYTRYDSQNAEQAAQWIREQSGGDEPWTLMLGIALPHPPNLVPQEYFDLYKDVEIPMPPQWRSEHWPAHPGIQYARQFLNFTEQLPEDVVRRFLRAYYGAVSYVDALIGTVLKALRDSPAAEDTMIVYASDHGEDLGARGLFGKFHMYDEATAIPLIISGPGVPTGKSVGTPVSLVDLYQTFLDAAGVPLRPEEHELPGESLLSIATRPDEDRSVFGEYHGVGSRDAVYMLREQRYKYVHYVDAPPMLFDMDNDPDELANLADAPEHRDMVELYEKRLREIVDPDSVNQKAKAAQRAQVEAAGGEEAVRARGFFDNSPPPGESAVYITREK